MDNYELIEITKKLENIERASNPRFRYENDFFRIMRFSEQNFKKYKFFTHANYLKVLFLLLGFIPTVIFRFFTNILFVALIPGEIPSYENKKINAMFISHATKSNDFKGSMDRFYGLLINDEIKSSHLIIYLNNLSIFKNLVKQRKNSGENYYLLTKNLDIGSSLIEILRIFIDGFYRYLCIFSLQKFQGRQELGLYLGALYSQCGRRTISNHFINLQLSRLFNCNKVGNLVMTFEGHAYEYFLKSSFRNSNNKGSVLFYQHSPISLGQFSALNPELIDNTKILFSSEILFNWFKGISIYKNATLLLIGSNKYAPYQNNQHKVLNSVLLAPEGSNKCTLRFLKLVKILKNINGVEKIRLRLHPDQNLSLRVKLKIKILKSKFGLEISNSTLNKDLLDFQYCIYSASSVGAESISFNAIPVFYGTRLEKCYTDPLFLYRNAQENFIDYEAAATFDLKKLLPLTEIYYTKYNIDLIESLFR